MTSAQAAPSRKPARTARVRQAAARVVIAANEKTKTPTPHQVKKIAEGGHSTCT